jgi:hypothetical protein
LTNEKQQQQQLERPDKPDSGRGSGKFKELSEEEEAKLSFKDKVTYMTRKYGWIALGTYTGVYLTTLSSIALAIKFGVDVQSLIESLGLARWIDPANLHPEAGVLVMAFILTKFTSPIRIVIVATITPYIARFVRGFMSKSA